MCRFFPPIVFPPLPMSRVRKGSVFFVHLLFVFIFATMPNKADGVMSLPRKMPAQAAIDSQQSQFL